MKLLRQVIPLEPPRAAVSAVLDPPAFLSMELVQLVSPMVTPQPIKLPLPLALEGEEAAAAPPIPMSSEFTFLIDRHSVVIDAQAPGVFRLRFGTTAATSLLVDPEPEAIGEAYVIEVPGGWRIVQGLDALDVLRAPLRFRLVRLDDMAVPDGAATEITVLTVNRADTDDSVDEKAEFPWQVVVTPPTDTGVYGLSRPTSRLGHRHVVFDSLAQDKPDDLEAVQSHFVPFCWSPHGWGIFANTLQRTVFAIDHPAWQDDAIQLCLTDVGFDCFLFAGTPADILNQYVHLTGRPLPAPLWSLGVWLGAGSVAEPDAEADEAMPLDDMSSVGAPADAGATPGSVAPPTPFGLERMVAAARQLREQGWSFDAVSLSPGPGFGLRAKQGFEWQGSSGSIRRGLANLKALHARVCVDEWPVVTPSSAAFEEFSSRGWLLPDHAPRVDVPPSLPVYPEDEPAEPGLLLNLLQNDAVHYWRDKHKPLLDDGVDVFRLPAACATAVERAYTTLAPDADQARMQTQRYLHTYFQSIQEVQQNHRSASDVLVWADQPTLLSQRHSLLAGPVVTPDWAGLQAALLSALNAGMAGISGQLWDIGTLENGAAATAITPELFLRWLALSAFAPFVRLPVGPDAVLWRLNAEQTATAQMWLNLRYRLLPYQMGAIEDAARMGVPVLRAMPLAFPSDPQAHQHPLQFLCGPALMIAPITDASGEVEVYFPKGEAWWELSTGNRYEGGETYRFSADYDHLPVFGRDGHMLCLGPVAHHTAEFNSARLLDEVWLFGMPMHHPCVMRNKIRVMQMQGSSYAKGLEGLKILPAEGLEIKRRGAEVRISRIR